MGNDMLDILFFFNLRIDINRYKYKRSRARSKILGGQNPMKKLFATLAVSVSMLIASPAFAYTVQSGDTMSDIAKENDLSLQELSTINPQVSNIDLIFVGQTINTTDDKSVKPVPAVKKVEKAVKTESKTSSVSTDSYTTLNVEATAYTAYCYGCSGVTATGIDLRSNPNQKVIAVDPNVIPLGSKVYVEGYGMAIAGDTGGAIKGNRIDLFVPNRSDALDFGRKTIQVKVYK